MIILSKSEIKLLFFVCVCVLDVTFIYIYATS